MKAKIEAPLGLCLGVTQNLAQFTLVLFLSGTPGTLGRVGSWIPPKEAVGGCEGQAFCFRLRVPSIWSPFATALCCFGGHPGHRKRNSV